MEHEDRRDPAYLDRAAVGRATQSGRWSASTSLIALALLLSTGCDLDVDALERSVGRVFCTAPGAFSTGTGFVIAEGRIVTNAHVVTLDGRPCDTIEIAFDRQQRLDARIEALDARRDFALLAVDAPTPPALSIHPGPAPKSAALFVIGFPGGADQRRDESNSYVDPSISGGIVNRQHDDPEGVALIQTNAAMNPGNSGGPAFDACGRVVGVATKVRRGTLVEQLNWAVHAAELVSFLDEHKSPVPIADSACTPMARLPVPPAALGVAAALTIALGALLMVVRRRPRPTPPPAPPPGPRPRPAPHPAPGPVVPRPDLRPANSDPAPPTDLDEVTEAAEPRLSARVVDGALRGLQFAIEDGCTIGRDAEIATVVVPGETRGISRRHVELRVRGGKVQVKDCWSRAGTRIDDTPLKPGVWAAAASGARVRVGQKAMTLVID